jgi:hypothetical protein
MQAIDASTIIIQTQNWIQKVVIGGNFCPFASKEFVNKSIHYQVDESGDTANCLELLITECERLDQQTEIATTLLILPKGFEDFEKYLDLVWMAEELLSDQGYEGIYQVASFHPDYCFAGTNPDDASNYTNKSLYPMLHLLREDSITEALGHYPEPEKIPERNIVYAREKGSAYFIALLKDCISTKHP